MQDGQWLKDAYWKTAINIIGKYKNQWWLVIANEPMVESKSR